MFKWLTFTLHANLNPTSLVKQNESAISERCSKNIEVVWLFFLQQDNNTGLSLKDVLRDLKAKGEDRIERRMFACDKCDKTWWRRVGSRKPVTQLSSLQNDISESVFTNHSQEHSQSYC